ncbi:hypothetical protein CDAR_253931 [Caerostris darwini]|uniref:Uncharacterized protein n=1 Tax=Caerostris darwini TaxID=1538125 RepID=A0AAV4N9J5_9ARAC|nr:hypothetical protein CDAR_253931 [Caerostris darwini]
MIKKNGRLTKRWKCNRVMTDPEEADDLELEHPPKFRGSRESRDWMDWQPVQRLPAVAVSAGLSENRKIDTQTQTLISLRAFV